MKVPSSEYHPYYGNYISLSQGESVVDDLEKNLTDFLNMMEAIPSEKLHFAYENGKWTVGEVLMHILDAERVFQHRAFRFARNDKTDLPGFEQDEYVPESHALSRTKEDITSEFLTIRNSTIQLFRSFDGNAIQRIGVANGAPMSVRALGRVICGHQIHHLRIIRERYL